MTVPDKSITPLDAGRWLARMAAADGVMTANERRVIKEFATEYNLDAAYLLRLAYGKRGAVDIPEVEPVSPSEYKGRRFEEAVAALCADRSRFRIKAWRSDKIIGNVYAAENLSPDLHLSLRCDGSPVAECFVECKYRSGWGTDGIDLSRHLDRYTRLTRRIGIPLLFALGVGADPARPEELYIIPSTVIRYDRRLTAPDVAHLRCCHDADAFHSCLCRHLGVEAFKP